MALPLRGRALRFHMNGVSPPTLPRVPQVLREIMTPVSTCVMGGASTITWADEQFSHTSFLMENYCLDPKQMTRLHQTKPSFLPTMMICGFPARKKVGSKDHVPYKGLKSEKTIQVGMMKVIQNGCQRRYPGWVGRFLFTHTKFLSCLA